MYQIINFIHPNTTYSSVLSVDEGKQIPFDPANTDYQQFKADILAGKELQDADGKTLSQTEAEAFIATLP